MSMLAPLFLLGLALIALPVWLHRLQTQTPEREPFSSAMLLEASEQRMHMHKKLRFLLLLASRIALLALLALAFAKPVLESYSEVFAGDSVALHLIVVDTSFSMGMDNRLDAALTTAGTIIDGLEPGQQAQIISADNHTRIIGRPDNDPDRLKSNLNAITASETRLDFGALISNLNGLLGEYEQNTAIHLISDFQNTGLPSRFADLIPRSANSRSVELFLHPVAGNPDSNWSIASLRPDGAGLKVTVRGYHTEEQQKTVTLYINGTELGRQSKDVPASGQVEFEFPKPELNSGDNRVEAGLSPADGLRGDDRFYAVIENTPPTPVLFLTTNPASLAVTYLKTALETGDYLVETVSIPDLDPRILPRYPWIAIDDLGTVDERLAGVLTDYLNSGGAVFAALGGSSQGLNLLPVTRHPVQASGFTDRTRFHSVTRIDTSHPVLAKATGWRSVNISRIVVPGIDNNDRILIALEGNMPLLLERRFDQGRLMLLTTSLDNSWSDLPIHSVFVSFISETARYLGNEDSLQRQQYAGASILLSQAGGVSGQVLDPSGQTILTLEDTHKSRHVELNQTGFYEVYTPGRQRLVAVNPEQRESDTSVISMDMMERWRAAGQQAAGSTGSSATGTETVRLELWHGLLLLLVLIVLAESILGNRYLDYRMGQ